MLFPVQSDPVKTVTGHLLAMHSHCSHGNYLLEHPGRSDETEAEPRHPPKWSMSVVGLQKSRWTSPCSRTWHASPGPGKSHWWLFQRSIDPMVSSWRAMFLALAVLARSAERIYVSFMMEFVLKIGELIFVICYCLSQWWRYCVVREMIAKMKVKMVSYIENLERPSTRSCHKNITEYVERH